MVLILNEIMLTAGVDDDVWPDRDLLLLACRYQFYHTWIVRLLVDNNQNAATKIELRTVKKTTPTEKNS
jgi:hypothetical protein